VEITSAVEDYLKAIYNLAHPPGGSVHVVSTSALAERLGVAAPSVSAMLARTDNAGLTTRHARAVRLTVEGQALALTVVRRHRLVETMLYQQLGVPWDEVHEEAERMEHAISDRLEGYLDRALGYPTHDPHGDPIPSRRRPTEPEGRHLPLVDAPAGCSFLVRRVSDANPAVLRHLADHGVLPDVTLTVLRHDPFAGPTWIHIRGGVSEHALSAALAQDVFGEVVETVGREQAQPEVAPPQAAV